MRSIYTFFLFLFLMFSFNTWAQEKEPLFSFNFENSTITDVIQKLESASPYYFYYDSLQLDSFRFTLSVQNQPLQSVLKEAFKGTDIHFSIDPQQHVFISRQLQVLTTLPSGFTDEKKVDEESYAGKALLSSATETRKAVKTSSENKLYEIGIKSEARKGGNAILTG